MRSRRARPPVGTLSSAAATLFQTDRFSTTCSVWKVRRTPNAARRFIAMRKRSAPSTVTVPAERLTKPLMTLSSVVLPAPFGPTSPGDLGSDIGGEIVQAAHAAEFNREVADFDHNFRSINFGIAADSLALMARPSATT